MNDIDNLLPEAVCFFKRESGFERLFVKMIDRYVSLGRIGGTVTITNLRFDEQEALSTFFGKDYSHQKTATVKLQAFEQQLQATRFKSLSLLSLLKAYAGKSLKTKAEHEAKHQAERAAFFQQFSSCNDELVQAWLEYVEANGRGTKLIHSLFEHDRESAKAMLELLIQLLQEIDRRIGQDKYERLPLFSQRMTGNPHALDGNRELGAAFLKMIQWLKERRNADYEPILKLTTEQTNELLQYVKIYRDDIANFVTCIGLTAKMNKKISRVFEQAFEEKVVLNVPLREVLKFTYIASMVESTVVVVENSGIFSELVHYFSEDEYVPPLICLHGQPKLAGLMMLDRLAESGASLFYAGDWDPEGLLIAERLCQRYPRLKTIWTKHSTLYQSTSGVEIPDHRLKKLDHVHQQQLQQAKQQLLAHQIAFYQEQYVDVLIEIIERQLEY